MYICVQKKLHNRTLVVNSVSQMFLLYLVVHSLLGLLQSLIASVTLFLA